MKISNSILVFYSNWFDERCQRFTPQLPSLVWEGQLVGGSQTDTPAFHNLMMIVRMRMMLVTRILSWTSFSLSQWWSCCHHHGHGVVSWVQRPLSKERQDNTQRARIRLRICSFKVACNRSWLLALTINHSRSEMQQLCGQTGDVVQKPFLHFENPKCRYEYIKKSRYPSKCFCIFISKVLWLSLAHYLISNQVQNSITSLNI